jgi:hypothetical protein
MTGYVAHFFGSTIMRCHPPCVLVERIHVAMSKNESGPLISFQFRGRTVPVSHVESVTRDEAVLAVHSSCFQNWVSRCEIPHGDKQIEIHSVLIQSVDLFGARGVGFVKIKSHCTLVDGRTHHETPLPGICFLRGNAVTILVVLRCDDGREYSLLVDQPRVPIGQASCLELPAGMCVCMFVIRLLLIYLAL